MTAERPWSPFLAKLALSPSRRRIIANAAWLFLDKAVYGVVGVLIGAWVARYLRPASFGLYSYALAFVGFLAPVAGLGLQSIVVRDIVRQPTKKDEILGTAMTLRLGASSLVVAVLLVALGCGVGTQDRILRWMIAIISSQLIFSAFGETVTCWFESQLQSRYVVWARNSAAVLAGLLKVGLILACAPLVAFGVASAAQFMIFACGALAFYQITGNRLSSLSGRAPRGRQMLADSWPLIFSAVAIVTYMRIDQIMLGHLAGNEVLGIYSVALRISEVWYFFPTAVAASLFPAIVRSQAGEAQQVYQMHMQAFFDLLAGMAYFIALPLALIASPLVILLYGAEYAEAAPILKVHIWALVFVSLGAARGRWLIAENLARFLLFATVLGAVVNVCLNFLLIPRFGGVGAAWATLFSQATAAYLSSLLYFPTWQVFKQATVALLVPLRLPSLLKSVREIGLGRP